MSAAALPGASPGPTAPPGTTARLFNSRYVRGLEIAVVVIVAGWQVAGAAVLMVTHLSSYPSPGVEVTAWIAQAALIALGSVLLLRGRLNARLAGLVVAADLAAGVAAIAGCPPGGMLSANWAWGTIVWVGLLVLLHRPLRELLALIAVAALITFTALAAVGDLHRRSVAGFIAALYAQASIQLAVVIAARALSLTASQAAEAADDQARTATRRRIADAVHADRQARYRQVQERAGTLLTGLADGSLHPDDPGVQQRCAIEAARLRRMFAESDEVPNPLLPELQACADLADRREVALDWAVSGTVPQLPAAVRRELTEAALVVLATTPTRARVTVVADRDGVAVSLFCDSPAEPPSVRANSQIEVTSQRDEDGLWMEARWPPR